MKALAFFIFNPGKSSFVDFEAAYTYICAQPVDVQDEMLAVVAEQIELNAIFKQTEQQG